MSRRAITGQEITICSDNAPQKYIQREATWVVFWQWLRCEIVGPLNKVMLFDYWNWNFNIE